MNDVVLSIGSNYGKRAESIKAALAWLSATIGNLKESHIYETPDFTGKSTFYMNAVAEGHTDRTFDELNSLLKEYEHQQGRNESMRARGLVPVDIDIVIWNGDILRERDFNHNFFQIGYKILIS